jgi:transposase
MSKKPRPVFSVEQKLAWVRRLLAGESVKELASELKLSHQALYKWLAQYRGGGASNLSTSGHPIRPRPGKDAEPPPTGIDDLSLARHRIATLERKVGQQQVDLDFFRQALRHVRAERRPSDGPGATKSTKSSRR